MKSIFLLVFFLGSNLVYSQDKTALQLEWKANNDNTEEGRTNAYVALSDYYLRKDFFRADSLGKVLSEIHPLYQRRNRIKLVLAYLDILEKTANYRGFVEQMKYFDLVDFSDMSAKTKAKIYAFIGFNTTFSNNRKKAQATLKKGLANAKAARDFSQACNILNLLAYESLINREEDKALFYTKEALEFARRSSDKRDLAFCFNIQANIYKYFGKNETALRKNLLALELLLFEEAYYELSRFSIEIGQQQEAIHNLSGAKYHYEMALKNAELLNDKGQMGLAYSNIANILRLEGKNQESLQLNLKALQFINSSNDLLRYAETEKNIGLNYLDNKKYAKAEEYFLHAIEHYESGGNPSRSAEVYYQLGKLYLAQENLELALSSLNKSIMVADNFGSEKAKYKTYPLIAEIYRQKGSTSKALKYAQEYITFINLKENDDSKEHIAALGEEFRSKERDRMISSQAESLEKQKRIRQLTESKLENATLRSRLQTYLIITFLIVVILTAIIAVIRYRQVATQQKRIQAEMSQTLLRAQMNPHFIFNAMSVIQSYIYDNDVQKSSQFLVSFSRLIRLILENSPKEYISLETEIEILTKYLETQKLRFEKRFEYEIICPETLLFDRVQIPPMITQPFVENSIEHGQLHQIKDGKITIRFGKVMNQLIVEIEDNGVGRQSAQSNGKVKNHRSMAISITEKRIKIINEKENSSGSLTITDLNKDDRTGTKVLISLPYKKEVFSSKKVG